MALLKYMLVLVGMLTLMNQADAQPATNPNGDGPAADRGLTVQEGARAQSRFAFPVRIETDAETEQRNRVRGEAAEARERRDVNAQESMASSTKEMLRQAWLQVVLGAIGALIALAGTLSLFYSLKLNRDATYAAIRAAEAAEQSLLATQRAQLGLVRFDTGRSVDDVGSVMGLACQVIWQNFGPTVAQNVTLAISSQTLKLDAAATYDFPPADNLVGKGIFPPGVPRHTAPVHISLEDLWAVWRGERRVIIYSICEYDDVFRQTFDTPRRVTKTCSEIILPGPPDLIGRQDVPYMTNFRGWGLFNEAT